MRKDEEGNECPETLGEYRDLISAMVGEDNRAIQFLDDRIAASADGRSAVVILPDSAMRALLFPLLLEPKEDS